MPKKTHKLEAVSIKKETHDVVREIAKKRNLFEYEVIEEKFKK